MMTAVQKAAYGTRIEATANQWLPTVKRMRPDHTWDDIARVLKQRRLDWTPERLRRAVKWMVSEGMTDAALLRKSPPRLPEDRLMTLVTGIPTEVAKNRSSYRRLASKMSDVSMRVTPRSVGQAVEGEILKVGRVTDDDINHQFIAPADQPGRAHLRNVHQIVHKLVDGAELVLRPQHELAARPMKAFGGMIALEPKGGLAAGKAFMDATSLITRAVSLGDAETLVQHPVSMTHSKDTIEELAAHGFTDGLIRLSVGLEDYEDLRGDILQALDSAGR